MIEDIMYFSGIALVSGGVGLIYQPAGIIVLGIFLIISAIVPAKATEKKVEK